MRSKADTPAILQKVFVYHPVCTAKKRKEAELTESFYPTFPSLMGSSAFPAFHSTHPRTKDKLFFCI